MRKRGGSAACLFVLLLLAASVSAQVADSFNRTVALNVQEYSGYIIEFDELPVIAYRKSIENSVLQNIDAQAKSHRAKISLQHNNAKNEILKRLDRKSFASKGSMAILGEYSDVFNGIALNLSDKDAEKIKDLPGVRKMHPNVAVRTALMDSVPLMKADAVWQLSDSNGNSVTGKNVTIAIIDTGVDYTHPDLGGCLGAGCRVIGGYDFYNKDSNPMDDNGHGTHVAATAAGSGTLPDGRSIKGVAPDAKIIAYKVLSSGGSGFASDIIAAIERSTDQNQDGNFADHVDIISMSLGGFGNPDDPMSAAVDSASDIGVLSVIAAGNSGPSYYTVSSPGTARSAVTIAAADKSDLIASFSSRGPTSLGTLKPDIAAPGVLICAARTPVFTPWTSNPSYAVCGGDDKRVLLSGTSMATPHVAGAAALIKQMHPDWKPEQIKNAMKSSSRDLGSDVYTQGAGRIDALAAHQVTLPPLSARLSSTPSSYCMRNQIIVSGFVNGSNLAAPYVFEYGSGLTPSSWTQISSSSVLGNHSFAFNATGLSGKYAIRLRAKNSFGNLSEDRIVDNLKDLPCKPGFPYTKWYGNDWIHVNGPAVADFDNDGMKEIALHASIDRENGSVFVVGSNGALKFGWPRYGISWADSSVAAGDIDNNGDLELVAVGRGYNVFRPSNFSRVFIYNHDGSGFNSSTGFFGQMKGDAIFTDAVLDDLDNDGKLEVIVPSSGDSVFSKSDMYVWKGSGQGYIRSNGSFSSAEYGFRSSAAVGDLDGDSRKEMVAGNNYNRTFMWSYNGSGYSTPSGYFRELFFTQRSPVLADLDKNGDLEIIFGQNAYGSSIWGSSSGALHVLNHDGSNFAGFPQNINGNPMSSPAVGDIDGDGNAEIVMVVSGSPAKIFAFRKDGSVVAGWPVLFGNENPTYSPPTIADIDGDGTQEIMLATIINQFPSQPQYTTQVLIFNHDGTVQKKYDNIEDCFNVMSPIIPADIDNDGKTELVFSCFGLFGMPTVGNAVINVHALDLGTQLGKIEWQTEHHDFRHSGLYSPINQTAPSPSCGNGICETGESSANCFIDCKTSSLCSSCDSICLMPGETTQSLALQGSPTTISDYSVPSSVLESSRGFIVELNEKSELEFENEIDSKIRGNEAAEDELQKEIDNTDLAGINIIPGSIRKAQLNGKLDDVRSELRELRQNRNKNISDHKAKIAAEHDSFKNKVKGQKIRRESSRSFNGFALDIPQQEAGQLKQHPEVKQIFSDKERKIDLMKSVSYINADKVWSMTDASGSRLTGKGTKIAIIDTGVDYNHADLSTCGTQPAASAGTESLQSGTLADGSWDNIAIMYDSNLQKFLFAKDLQGRDSQFVPENSGIQDVAFGRINSLEASITILSNHSGFDIDHDGRREVILRRYTDIWTSVFDVYERGAGNNFTIVSTFQTLNPGSDSYYPSDVGDSDNDGLSELVIFGRTVNNFSTRIYESVSPDSYPSVLVWQLPEDWWSVGAKIADTDNDGRKEIIVAGQTYNYDKRVAVYENTGNNSYIQTFYQAIPLMNTAQGMEVADDLDGDGKKEILFGGLLPDAYGSNGVYVFESNGDNSYQQIWSAQPRAWDGQILNLNNIVYAGDLDNDGKKEFLVGGRKTVPDLSYPFWSAYQLYEANGDNSFVMVSDVFRILGGFWDNTAANVADVDGDGRKEIIVSMGATLKVYKNSGDNLWSEAWVYSAAGDGRSIGANDLNRNGREEFLFDEGPTGVYEAALSGSFEYCRVKGDEDNNGLADCADISACPTGTYCNANSTYLCKSQQCVLAPQPENCRLPGDEDQDGMADCADTIDCPSGVYCDYAGTKYCDINRQCVQIPQRQNFSCKVTKGWDFFNDDNDPMDDHGHGTHVAATAAGNGVLKGVAPDAEVYAYKVCSSGGSCWESDIIAGIEMATDPNQDGNFEDHADVISISLGGSGTPDDPDAKAVDNAFGRGSFVSVAAGNSGPSYQTVLCPGCARNATTVAAWCKPEDVGVNGYCSSQIASFSSRGPVVWSGGTLDKPDITAPGVNICAAEWGSAWSTSRCYDLSHVAISGTSMATPHVAGAAALLIQLHPEWSAQQVKDALKNNALNLGFDKNTQGSGLLDIYAAVANNYNITQYKESYYYYNLIDNQCTVNISLSASGNFTLRAKYAPNSCDDIWDASINITGGNTGTLTRSGLSSGRYAVKVSGAGSFVLGKSQSCLDDFTKPSINVSSLSQIVGADFLLSATVSDSNSLDRCEACVSSDGICDSEWSSRDVVDFFQKGVSQGVCSFTWRVSNYSDSSTYYVGMRVFDTANNSAEAVQSAFLDKSAPVISGLSVQKSADYNEAIQFSASITDNNKVAAVSATLDKLSVGVSKDNATGLYKGSITAPSAPGVFTFRIAANDAVGFYSAALSNITVNEPVSFSRPVPVVAGQHNASRSAVKFEQDAHVAWEDSADIYYSRVSAAGQILDFAVPVSATIYNSRSPSVDYENGAFVAWQDDIDGNREIYFRAIGNSTKRVTFNSFDSVNPRIIVQGGFANVFWIDSRAGTNDLYYAKLDLAGNKVIDDSRLAVDVSSYSVAKDVPLRAAWISGTDAYYGRLQDSSLANVFKVSPASEISLSAFNSSFLLASTPSGIRLFIIDNGPVSNSSKAVDLSPSGKLPSVSAGSSGVHLLWSNVQDSAVYAKTDFKGGLKVYPKTVSANRTGLISGDAMIALGEGNIELVSTSSLESSAPVLSVDVKDVRPYSSLIEVRATEPSFISMKYGKGSLDKSYSSPLLNFSQRIFMADLEPASQYNLQLTASDVAGNSQTSSLSFTTPSARNVPALPTTFYGLVRELNGTPLGGIKVTATWIDTSNETHTTNATSLSENEAASLGNRGLLGYYLFNRANVNAMGGTVIRISASDMVQEVTVPASPGSLPFNVSSALVVDRMPPSITIISPLSQVYPTPFLSLNFSVSEPAGYSSFSLNGQEPVVVTGREGTDINFTASLGLNTLTVTVKDRIGLQSSSSVSFTVDDRIPPSVLLNSLPYARNITLITANVSDPTNALAYCEVCVGSGCTWLTANDDFDPGDMKGTCSYSWDSNLVADGLHSIAIRAYDAYNNIGHSSPMFTTVDNTPPANTSFNAAPVEKVQRVSIKWSKSSEPDFRRYIIYRSQSPPEVIATIVNPDQTTFEDTAVSSGQTYKYAVAAEDMAGNVNTISFTQVTVSDFIPPNITIFSPQPILYSSKSVPLTFYSTEPLGGCEYALNGQRTYIFGNTTLSAQEGNNSLFLSCNDTSHNPGNASVLFRVDTTPPARISANVYPVPKKNELNISWTVSSAADFSYYSVYRSSSPFSSVSAVPEIARIGNKQVIQYTDLNLVSQQDYYYAVTATDSLGNENKSVSSVAGAVSDTVKPSIFLTSPASVIYNSSMIKIQYAANEPLSWCGYSLNSGNVVPVSNNSLVSSPEGSSILVLYCNDTSNNQGIVSVAFEVNAEIPKNPALNVTPVAGQNALSLSWQPSSERDFASYSIYRGNLPFSSASSAGKIASVSSPQYTDLGVASQETYYYAVTAVDKYGYENLSVASVSGTVVDTAKPILSIASPLPQLYKSAVQLQYSANEPLSWCGYVLNSGSLTAAPNNSAIPALEGSNVLVLYCNDSSANQESVSVSFNMDASLPRNVKINVTSAKGQNSLVLSWIPSSERDLASYKVYRNSSSFTSPEQAVLAATVSPLSSQYIDSGLASQATYYYALSSVDSYGNENISLVSVPGTVPDIIPPAQLVTSVSSVTRNISLKVDWTKSPETDFYNYNIYRSQAPFSSTASATRIASIPSKNTLTYIDFNVASQQNYYYAVAANDTSGNENPSVISSFATVYDLIPPQLSILSPLNTTYNSRQLTLQIYVNEPSDCSFTLNNGSPSQVASSISINALEGGNKITARCSDLSSNPANASLIFSTDTVAPLPVTLINVSPAKGQNSLTLKWNSSSDSDFASYAVYRSGSFFTSTSEAARILTTASLNYTDSNLASENTYYYAVTAIDRVGNENSLVSSKPGKVADTIPPLPVSLVVSPVAGKTMLSLNWSKASEPDLSYYALYRSSSPFMNTAQASKIATSASESYNDVGLKSETVYYYAVTAVDFEGNENSAVSSVSAKTADITPPNITIISPQNKTYALHDIPLQYAVSEPSLCEYSLGSDFIPEAPSINANEGSNLLSMRCSDPSGNIGNASLSFSTDTIPPAPIQISGKQIPRKEQINVTWTPLNDAGFVSYTIYRSSTPFSSTQSASPLAVISSRSQSSYLDTTVKSEGLYYYAINAKDAMGNMNSTVESYYVAVEDLTPPVISISSPVPRTYSEYSVPLAFSSNEPVANCSIVLNSQQGNASANITAGEGSNSLTVSCQDLNFNPGSAAVSFNVNAQAPPQIPVSAAWSNGALLSWPASPVSDLKHYAVYRSNTPFSDSRTASLIGTTTATSFRDVNVESQALYYYAVAGVDIFNHENTSVIPKEFIVPDIAAPAPVLGLEVGQVIGEASLILTWQPSPENDVAGYSIYRSPAPFTQASPSFLISSVQNVSIFIDTGLESSASYHYAVVARDMNGNENLNVASVMGTTYDVSPPNISVEQVPSPVSGQVMLRALVYDNALSRTCEVCITQDVCSWQPASSNFPEGDRNGSCTFAWQAPVTGGIYMYSFRVSDAAGNRHEGQLLQAVLANISDVRIFTMPLYAGWNLVSFPVIPENNSVRSVLSSVSGNYTRALFYDAYTESWQSHFAEQSIFNPEETLLQVDLGKGYWVELRSNSTLTINGARASTYNGQLQAGWNLIGSPYDGSVDMGRAASSLNSQYYALFSYNATEQKWERYSPYPTISQPNTIKMLHPGTGYMIDMIQASPWNPQRQ